MGHFEEEIARHKSSLILHGGDTQRMGESRMKIVKLNELETREIPLGRKSKQVITEAVGAKNIEIGWISFPPRFESEKHLREVEELLIPLEGKGYIKTVEEEFDIAPGMIIFLAPGDAHWHGTRESSLTQYYIFAPPLPKK